MTFQEIFKQEGLYKSESFAKGVGFLIRKKGIDNSLELVCVQYKDIDDIRPIELDLNIYDGLFEKEYEQVFVTSQLFK